MLTTGAGVDSTIESVLEDEVVSGAAVYEDEVVGGGVELELDVVGGTDDDYVRNWSAW